MAADIAAGNLDPGQEDDLLSFLDSEDSRLVRSMCHELRLESGAVLFTDGDAADCLYFLAAGQLAVKQRTAFGRSSQVIALLQPGAVVGEAAVAGRDSHTATVCAIDACSLLRLEKQAYERLRHEYPTTAALLLERLLLVACLRLEKCSDRLSHVL